MLSGGGCSQEETVLSEGKLYMHKSAERIHEDCCSILVVKPCFRFPAHIIFSYMNKLSNLHQGLDAGASQALNNPRCGCWWGCSAEGTFRLTANESRRTHIHAQLHTHGDEFA